MIRFFEVFIEGICSDQPVDHSIIHEVYSLEHGGSIAEFGGEFHAMLTNKPLPRSDVIAYHAYIEMLVECLVELENISNLVAEEIEAPDYEEPEIAPESVISLINVYSGETFVVINGRVHEPYL